MRVISRIFLLIALCSLAVPAWASNDLHSQIGMHLLRPGTAAVTDLDGDRIPDVASGTKTGHGKQGYVYRVDLDLSGNPDAESFIVYSDEPTGLNVQAIDVDGDHDLDLVVTSHLRRDRIAVWVNDGNGQFTRSDSQRHDSPVWREGHSASPSKTTSAQVYSFEQRHLEVALRRSRIDVRTFHFVRTQLRPASALLSRVAVESARFRAPPAPAIP